MRKYGNEEFVTTEFGVSQESFLTFFNGAKEFVREQNNPSAFAASLHLGLTMIEANKSKMSFYEDMLGRKIATPEDIVAFALTIQLLVLEEEFEK